MVMDAGELAASAVALMLLSLDQFCAFTEKEIKRISPRLDRVCSIFITLIDIFVTNLKIMKIWKVALLSCLFVFSTLNSTAQKFCQELKTQHLHASQNTIDLRTDTFDVLKYWINASFSGLPADHSLDATTVLRVQMLEESSSITLDLLGLTVDYTLIDHLDTQSFQHIGSKLTIELPQSISVGDTFLVEVAYSGEPQSDALWGGFYFNGDYAFNLGVGFDADPHNYGRVWYPCFDNFVDRAAYAFNVEVPSDLIAMCNGELTGVIALNQSSIYHWEMIDPIPTYLASVAIAPYELIEDSVDGIPTVLASVAADTSDMKTSFENLPSAIRAFVNGYGEHSFSRVGFNMVPFNGGAMEHATNIAYPLFAISGGSKNYETLFAHELAHHWWGNTVTCRTQEDMWINEGWASFSERLFLEAVYGEEAYRSSIGSNHKAVVHYAHIRDGEALPVSGIGHANTYGMHVYDKGADMVHTLRGFMGDSAFFEACKSFQQNFKFQDVSTEDMAEHFQTFTSVDLDPFFNEWIKSAGFAHYTLLSVTHASDEYKIRIKQNQRLSKIKYSESVHYLQAFSAEREKKTFKILIKGEDDNILIPKSALPFFPVYWALDFDQKISDAITDEYRLLYETGSINMPQALFEGEVKSIPDTALFRVEHHWVSPDQYFNKIEGLAMSKERYWTVEGVWPEDLQISGTFKYNGLAPSNNPAAGFLDNELIKITEDSLVLLYRPNGFSDWQIHPDYEKNMGSAFNKVGEMVVSDLKQGQYTFGIYDHNLLSAEDELEESGIPFDIMPNPADSEVLVQIHSKIHGKIEITDRLGTMVKELELSTEIQELKIDVSDLGAGLYFIGVTDGVRAYERKPLMIK